MLQIIICFGILNWKCLTAFKGEKKVKCYYYKNTKNMIFVQKCWFVTTKDFIKEFFFNIFHVF